MTLQHIAQQIVSISDELDFLDEDIHPAVIGMKQNQLDQLCARLLRILALDLARIIVGSTPIYFKNPPFPHPDFTRK